MAKRGKRRVFQKQTNINQGKNIVVNTSSRPTEPPKDEGKVNEQYANARQSHVPAEAPALEVITNFFSKWSHWIAWATFFAGATVAYSSFNNDISNAKSDIDILQKTTKENSEKIVGVEKQQIIVSSDIRHMESQTNNLSKNITEVKSSLRKIELEQVKLMSINNKNR